MDIMFPPPDIRTLPKGERVDFRALCEKAGMKMIVSASHLPEVWVHYEDMDFKAVAPGRVAYCLSLHDLPGSSSEKARIAMNKLAYQFHDWAAKEIVSADNRRLSYEREKHLKTVRSALSPVATQIIAYLKRQRTAQISQISRDIGVSQPHISRAVKSLKAAGIVIDSIRESGRSVELRADCESALDTLVSRAFRTTEQIRNSNVASR